MKISGEVKSNRIFIFLGKFQERVEKKSCLWEFKKENLLPGTTTTCWSAHGCTWPKRYHYSNRTGMKTKVARINRFNIDLPNKLVDRINVGWEEWQYTSLVVRGRSQTTLTKFCPSLTTYLPLFTLVDIWNIPSLPLYLSTLTCDKYSSF